MDGTWVFRCRKCGSAFEILLSEHEHAVDFARDKSCPSCGSVPSEASQAEAMQGERWHKVIGYRSGKNTGAARRLMV